MCLQTVIPLQKYISRVAAAWTELDPGQAAEGQTLHLVSVCKHACDACLNKLETQHTQCW